jgi:deoxyribodipyrimidine photolyase-related protein
MEATLIFPHQLFQYHPAVQPGRTIYIIEEYLFFQQYAFHKQKLLLHRASMKYFEQELVHAGYTVNYIDSTKTFADIRLLIPALKNKGIIAVHIADVADNWLRKRLYNSCNVHGLQVQESDSPAFINTLAQCRNYGKTKKQYYQTAFYIDQRKKQNILIDKNGQPIGGRWTFDTDNRKRYPKNQKPPALPVVTKDDFIAEAARYVENNFRNNPGSTQTFVYPASHTAAEQWLEAFLKERFALFGDYEDAIVSDAHYLHHSVLSPLLNTGLLLPGQIVQAALDAAAKHNIPLNALEGFIRQLIGWREFVRMLYEKEGSRQRTKNFWGFTRKIPGTFRTGHTGIKPVDDTIKKLIQTGYNHHIERLMILGNFMLLCEFDPNEVYQWFMEMYIDAYDWVMVPNVYGMTLYADGGVMTTKPYCSGSNYVLKMSNYTKGDWCTTWDSLFWRFMHVHRQVLGKNMRLNMLIKTFDKMPQAKQQQYLQHAENYLTELDKS